MSVSVPRCSASWIDAVGDLDRVRQRERRVRRDEALRERAGDRDELERRARLVGVGDGAVALQRPSGRVRRVVRVVARAPAPSRAPRPSSGRARSPSRPSRPSRDTVLRSTCLGLRLDRVVDRREDVGALLLGRRADHVDRLAAAVAHDRLLARAGPTSLRSYCDLEPAEALVVDARVADHLRADAALRVRAPLLRIEAEAGEAASSGASAPWPGRRTAARRRTGASCRAAAGRARSRRRRGCRARRRATATRVAHLLRIGEDRRRLLADRELRRRCGRRSCRGRPAIFCVSRCWLCARLA